MISLEIHNSLNHIIISDVDVYQALVSFDSNKISGFV